MPYLLPHLFLAALHPVLGVDIARVGTFAAIDQVPEATLTIDSVVASTTVLLVVVVTTAYLVWASIAEHHVVAPQALMWSANLVPTIFSPFSVPTKFLARATPLVTTSTAAITASISSAVRLTLFPPPCGRVSSVPQPSLYIIGYWPQLHFSS